MNPESTTLRSERGAVLIMVVVAMVALLAFGAFVIDYGVMWTGRGQVQTAADAGALAGAVALAYDGPTDFTGAKAKASAVARANGVWGAAPDVQLADVTFPPCPPGAPGLPDTCVKVDAYRNQNRGNALPMYFGNLVGVASQGVRATATAQVFASDVSDCVKPFAIPDKWQEVFPTPKTWAPTDQFNRVPGNRAERCSPRHSGSVYSAVCGFEWHRLRAARGIWLAVTLKSGSPRRRDPTGVVLSGKGCAH